MKTEEIRIEDSDSFDAAVTAAAALLREDEVIALPTETVYGLAANAFSPPAVRKIFDLKGRPSHNPVIVHVATWDLVHSCITQWPPGAERLARAFWPGPLTMVLPASSAIPREVTAGGATVGIRWPGHPLMQSVIVRSALPLAAPSANPSNRVSPTDASHVRKYFHGRIPLIVDGGPSAVGIESTVIDLTSEIPRILRPGMIHSDALRAVLDLDVPVAAAPPGETLRSPGMLAQHYAPRARVALWSWSDERELNRRLEESGARGPGTHILCHQKIPLDERDEPVHVIPHDPEAYARALFSEWHRCDEASAAWIIMEAPPETLEWAGIWDRLRRAAGGSTDEGEEV